MAKKQREALGPSAQQEKGDGKLCKKTEKKTVRCCQKAVYETPNNQYRVYVGLKMGVGDANRLAVYIAKHANADINVDELAKAAVEKVIIEKVE